MLIDSVEMGNLPNYLFFFDNGSIDANWQGATKGFIGDVAVNGLVASERTSGSVPYAGTIYTNAPTLGAWQAIVNQNAGQASGSTNQVALIAGLETDLISAFHQINALPATPGFTSVSAQSLDGLNTQNGIAETFVINVTSGFQVSTQIDITGDPGDIYILRWDTDANPANGYQGIVKFQSGGAIVPHGGLKPTNFINVAGDINSSGGGSTPLPPYPQGPRYNDGQGPLIIGGQDFSGGGFFTGYWLTTGAPTSAGPGGLFVGPTQPLSNGIFVGGWYTLTTKFSMTSGTSGVYVSPPVVSAPAIKVQKLVSVDNGVTFDDADVPPGPTSNGVNPIFRYIVTNIGNVNLTNVTLVDSKLGTITIPTTSLTPGQSFTVNVTGTFAPGQNSNLATVTGQGAGQTVTGTNPANYIGAVQAPSISVRKFVSPDNGVTYYDADLPPGPTIVQGTTPLFRYIVLNNGNVTLNNITLTDSVLGPITIPTTTLAPGGSFTVDNVPGTWAAGLQSNLATVQGTGGGQTVTGTNPANYTGQLAAPAITVQKLVSPNGGITFDDADLPPGPNIPQGTNPIFRYIVRNTGNVTLTNVNLTDNPYGNITLPGSTLAPGESFTVDVTQTWVAGQHTNIATAQGTGGGQTVSAQNPANYNGVAANPLIKVVKYVSPDNGVTFYDADLPPGPTILQGTNPIFQYVVTNIGNVTLTNVTLTDSVLGAIAVPLTTLAPGGSFTVQVTGSWAAGQRTNLATVTGQGAGQTVTGTNPANYFGEAAAPAITLQKLVSADNGVTFDDADVPPGPGIPSNVAPIFRYIIKNTGNVTLSNLVLTDNKLGTISLPVTTLAPTGTITVDVTGTWQPGQNTNIGTVTGQGAGQTVTATNPANYFGITVPAIKVVKQVSPDGGINFFDADLPPGPSIAQGTNPVFRYIVTNIGNVTLTNVTLTDDKLGNIPLTITTLTPGQSVTVLRTGTWASGLNTNIATATGQYQGQPVTATNPANYTGVPAAPAIDVEKLVSADGGNTFVDADTPPGPNVPSTINPVFKYIVRNTGNVTLTNVTLTDNVLGTITLPGTTLAPGQSFTVIRTGTWAQGEHVNQATASGRFGNTVVTDTDLAHYFGVLVPTNFKQFSVEETLTIPSQKPDVEDILDTLVDVVIVGKRVINTIIGTSEEGQNMTGFKLLIEGVLHQKIEYIAAEPTQKVHAAEFKVPFSSFIILPSDFVEDSMIDVTAEVEDVYVKQLDKRHIFKNVTLRLEARVL